MALKRKLIPVAIILGALALSAACSQAKPTPTPPGNTPTVPTGVSTNGSPSPFLGASSLEAAGYTYYAAPQVSYSSTQQSGIWVGGSGKVVITPDLAILTVGVEAQNKSVDQARADAAQAMNAIRDVLKKNGIADKDIRTQSYSIYPQYVWNDFNKRQEITGYQVTNSLTVKSRNLDGVGALIDDVSKAGGNLTRINGISFTAEHPETYANQAREAAVKDAMAKAQQFATLTGAKLGKLVYISETGANVPIYQDYAKGALAMAEVGAPAPTPISPGEMEVTISVQAVFAIE